jgi:hypothetical protein
MLLWIEFAISQARQVNGWHVLRRGQSREGFPLNFRGTEINCKQPSEALSQADGGLLSCHAATAKGKKNR